MGPLQAQQDPARLWTVCGGCYWRTDYPPVVSNKMFSYPQHIRWIMDGYGFLARNDRWRLRTLISCGDRTPISWTPILGCLIDQTLVEQQWLCLRGLFSLTSEALDGAMVLDACQNISIQIDGNECAEHCQNTKTTRSMTVKQLNNNQIASVLMNLVLTLECDPSGFQGVPGG